MIVFFPNVGGNASNDHLMFFLDCPIRRRKNAYTNNNNNNNNIKWLRNGLLPKCVGIALGVYPMFFLKGQY
jgi:hypothetical protein